MSCLDVVLSEVLEHHTITQLDFHVIPHTMFGSACAFTVQDDDATLSRVLCLDGVYQSATYLDTNRFEPVFSYYKAFDLMYRILVAPYVLMIGDTGCS